MLSKHSQRLSLKKRLLEIDSDERLVKVDNLSANLLDLLSVLKFPEMDVLMGAFAPMEDEIPYLAGIAEFWDRLCFPRVLESPEEMKFYFCHPDTLITEVIFGAKIRQPSLDCKQEDQLAFLLVPGLGFSENGGRLGRGKGFYDKYLEKSFKGISIGLCFEEQLSKDLLLEEHDQKVDYLVTDRKWHKVL